MSTEATETTVTSVSATRHYGTRICGRYDPIRDQGRPFHESIDDQIVTEKVKTFITYTLDVAN